MKSPITGKELMLMREMRSLSFRKEEFEVVYHYYLCVDSKQQFEDDKLAELNIGQVYNHYREKHNIPFPDQIIEIRKKYGVSARKMSEILGFGVNTYSNYENGEIPSRANANLILLIDKPDEFGMLANQSGLLNDKLEKIIHKINLQDKISLLENSKMDYLEKIYTRNPLSSKTGYQVFNPVKTYQTILFFAEKLSPWKTKMNKLLFMIDFSHYKNYGRSITGLEYRAISYGPVPKDYATLFDLCCKRGYVEIVIEEVNDDFTGERLIPQGKMAFDHSLFSNSELEIINLVAEKFKKVTLSQLKEMSHEEKGWIDNYKERKLIDYRYGFDLIHA